MRRKEIVSAQTESTLFKLLINIWVPCFIIIAVARNPAFESTANIVWPPVMGFLLVSIGIGISWTISHFFFQNLPSESRTSFAYTTGVFNYGYIPIPLVESLFGFQTLGVLLVFNVGVEVGLWLFGMPMMAGSKSWNQIIKRIINPPLMTLVICVLIRVLNWGTFIPAPIWNGIETLAGCTIPIGILLVGMAIADHFNGIKDFRKPGPWMISCIIRNALMPGVFLTFAYIAPFTAELIAVIGIQAAMPCAVFPVVLAKHYGGDAKMATKIIFATSGLAFITTPLWLDYAFHLLKLK